MCLKAFLSFPVSGDENLSFFPYCVVAHTSAVSQEVRGGQRHHQPVCGEPAVALLAGLVQRRPLGHHQRSPAPQHHDSSALHHGNDSPALQSNVALRRNKKMEGSEMGLTLMSGGLRQFLQPVQNLTLITFFLHFQRKLKEIKITFYIIQCLKEMKPFYHFCPPES